MCFSKMFQKKAKAPRGRSTRAISATVADVANQWNASPEKTASTASSSTAIASASPASASASGTTSSSTARIASSGSTARTRANRATSARVSFPVPEPRSSTVPRESRPAASTTRSISSSGHGGRPSSYSRAVRPNASGGALRSGNSGEKRRALFLDHLTRDHEPLDLVRPLVDLRDLRVPHHPLDRVLLHVAVAAEDLYGIGRDLHRHVRAVELRHRRDLRQLRAVGAVVDQLPALVEEPARGFALRLHVSERRRDQLVLGDRLAHGLARLRIVERIVGRALGQPEPLGADPRPRAVEDPHCDPEPLALPTEQVVSRDAHVGEEELTGGRTLDPHLRLDPADLEAGRVSLDDEGGDALVAAVRIGLGEDDVQARDACVRDESFGAVEHVLVAVPPGLAAHRRRVRARARLRQRVGGQPLAARELRQEALLLVLGAGELDSQRAELLHGEDQAARGADLRDLLDRDERHQRARAGAPMLLVEHDPEQVVLPEELPDVPRELGAPVDLGRTRRNSLARENANQVADLTLFLAQRLTGHGAIVGTQRLNQ